jgi:hypothetical protein
MNSVTTGLAANTWTGPELEAYLQASPVTDSEGRQWRLTIHPAAKLLLPIVGDDYASFKADIQPRGQEKPVDVVAFTLPSGICTGAVLHGINRLGCCVELGLQRSGDCEPLFYPREHGWVKLPSQNLVPSLSQFPHSTLAVPA